MEKNPFMFAISGVKNSGKTTLITRLIPAFAKRGLKVAVIKHDGHEFDGDVPGTDTYRHAEAGAYGTAVYSKNKFMILKQENEVTEKKLQSFFPEADLILLEGLKQSAYPKVEVLRKGISEKLVSQEGSIVGVVSDFQPDISKGTPCFGFHQADALAELILDHKFIRTELSMVLLAGGQSSRMGRDKAGLCCGKDTFLEHQIRKGKKMGISDIIVSGYQGAECAERVVRDKYEKKGPLGGMEASLRGAEHRFCLILSVDTPMLPTEELYTLIRHSRQSSARATILAHHGKEEPLLGVYRSDVASDCEQELLHGKGSVWALLHKVGYEICESSAHEEVFFNINTPEEYERFTAMGR